MDYPGGIRYTSLRARNACFELGLPAKQLPRVPSREHDVRKERELTSPNDIVISYLQALRWKKRRGKAAADATIGIGGLRNDYVAYTSHSPRSLLPTSTINTRYTETEREMRERELKGILQQTKNCEAIKRVTFNDEVKVEEFKPNSAIVQKVKNIENGGNDVTVDSEEKVSPGVNVSDNGSESKAGAGKQGATGDERNDIEGVTKTTLKNAGKQNKNKYDETMTFISADGDFTKATKKTRENNQQLTTACKETADSANPADLLSSKCPIEDECSITNDTQVKIGSQSAHLSIQRENSEEIEILRPFVDEDRQLVKEISPSLTNSARGDGRLETLHHSEQLNVTLNEQKVTANASQNRLIDSSEENKDFSFQMDSNSGRSWEENFLDQVNDKVFYRRRSLKKKFATVGRNFPIITQELSSRASNLSDVIPRNDVNNDGTKEREDSADKDQNSSGSGKLQSDDKTLLSRDDVIKKVRDDARLNALRGQIATDKAAWSCVVRYPRHVMSQPNSGRTSPITADVMYGVTRRPKTSFPLEKNDTFPLSGGEKLTLYRHNFGQKFRPTSGRPSAFPTLMTSRFPGASFVTQRCNPVWVVPKTKGRWVRRKGSHIVRYEAGK